MSRRTRRSSGKAGLEEETSGPVEAEKPDVEMKVESDYLKTQIESIDSKLRIIGDKITPVDLKSVEDKMASLDRLLLISSTLDKVEKEFNTLATYAKIFFGLGAAGLLIYCVNGIVTLLNYLRQK